METVTTILSSNPPNRSVSPLAAPMPQASPSVAAGLAAAGSYAPRAGAVWVLWLRASRGKPPHEDF